MHAVQSAPVPEPLAAKLERLQADALETVHWVMLHLAKSLTNPQDADPAQPTSPADRMTTQRARLCLQAARDLLRFRPPGERERGLTTRLWRGGRGGKPEPTPDHTQDDQACIDETHSTADTHSLPAQLRARASSHATASQPANAILAAAGAGASRFGERIDSPLPPEASAPAPTNDSASSPPSVPLPSSVPSVSSVFQPSATIPRRTSD